MNTRRRHPKGRGGRVALAAAAAGVLATGGLAGPARAVPTPGFTPSSCERTNAGYRCTAGPIDVAPGSHVKFMTGVAAPSEAGYITSARAILVDAGGAEIPHHDVHLHHAVWANPTRADTTCDSYDEVLPDWERFFASGKERTEVVLPEGYGYHWSNGVPQQYTESAPFWGLYVHLDGLRGHSETHVRLDLGFVPESDAGNMTGVTPMWFDVRNCSTDPVYTVREGSGTGGIHKERWTYEMPAAGRFVFLGGHLHDGGLRLALRDVTAGRNLFTSRAEYGMEDDPWFLTGMSTYRKTPGKAVGPGHRLRLTAVYDSTGTRKDVMGIMIGAFVPRS